MERRIITISREFGSGGRLIGKALAEALGIPFYDKILIDMAAQKSGLSPDFVAVKEEKPTSSLLYTLATSTYSSGYPLHYDASSNEKVFLTQSEIITDLAKQGSCVIVGRCAGYVLRDDPDRFSVFVYGSFDSRMKRCIEEYGMEAKGLSDFIIRSDKSRANYHKYYTGDSWRDLSAYDLAINTARCGVKGAVDTILTMLGGID